MSITLNKISPDQLAALIKIEESHFVDLKSVDILPSSLTKTLSALCNTSGGEIYVGIEEAEGAN